MTFSSSLSSYFVYWLSDSQNSTIDSPLSEHELALPGSGYPSLASNVWSSKDTVITQMRITGGV